MALIKCSDCGKEISDTASSCIHCGCPVEKKIICEECGKALLATERICPNCGWKSKEKKISISFGNKKIWIVAGVLLAIFLIVPKSFHLNLGKSGSTSTHERIELNDYNISDYVKVSLQGALRDYRSNYFHSVYYSGTIAAARYDLQCENVSFTLEMSTHYKVYGSSHSDEYSKTVYLDTGCNATIGETRQLRYSIKQSEGYNYTISNVRGSVLAPKIVVE